MDHGWMSERGQWARLVETGFEQVYVENDWYDGPRSGLASVGGLPHYFQSADGYANPEVDTEEFLVWPADRLTLDMEREQWNIFCSWNARYEAGEVAADTHPGGGGVDARYDELQVLLDPRRKAPHGCPTPRARVAVLRAARRSLPPGRSGLPSSVASRLNTGRLVTSGATSERAMPQPRQIGRGLTGNRGCWRWPKPVAAEVGIPQVKPQLAPPRS